MENCVAPGLDEFDVLLEVVLSLVRVVLAVLLITPRHPMAPHGTIIYVYLPSKKYFRGTIMVFTPHGTKIMYILPSSKYFRRFFGLLQNIIINKIKEPAYVKFN